MWIRSAHLALLFVTLPLLAQDIQFKVGANDTVTSPQLTNGQPKTLPSGLKSIRLDCDGGKCAKATAVKFAGGDVCKAAKDAAGCDGTVNLTAPQVILVEIADKSVFDATLRPSDQTSDSTNRASTRTLDVNELLKVSCQEEIDAQRKVLNVDSEAVPAAESGTYSRKQDRATFLVDVFGNVYAAPTENVDEDDTVIVRVVANEALLDYLRVRRKSVIRTPANRIVGEGLKVPAALLNAQTERTERCAMREFTTKDFNPGKGEIEILAQVGTQSQSLGTFDFIVDPLYNGMFSLGTATSELTDRAFKLRAQGDQKVIYSTEEGDTTRYVVYFTPFLKARDIEKSGQPFWHHINPSFGISTQKTASNAYAGVSIDYKGFVVSGGWHFSRINDLSSTSGLKEGSVFAGQESEIPQAKRWENGSFIGVSIDLRSAVALFQTLVSGAS